jgi:hypothetical protein
LVRYYAAAFCVCIIAALRGIDAQRSEVVQKFARFWHCSAYDSKTGGGAGSPCLGPCVLPLFRTPRGGRPLISIGRTTFCFRLYPTTGFSTRVSPRLMPRRRLRMYCVTSGICLRMWASPTLVSAKSFAGTLSGTSWRIVPALWVFPGRSLNNWGVGVGLR